MSATTSVVSDKTVLTGVKITVLVEDSVVNGDLRAEHGLSLWLETDRHRLLLDTGQGGALVPNANSLGIAVRGAEAVVFSHGHYDHVGGLPGLVETGWRGKLYLHPEALWERFSLDGAGKCCSVGAHGLSEDLLSDLSRRLNWTTTATEVVPGVWVTGEIPRRNDFESVGGSFYLDESGARPDELNDDQALFFSVAEGVVVVMGCAHAGVVNTLRRVAELTGGRKIHAVVGGLHLLNASDERICSTVEVLRQYGVDRLVLGHCTGDRAMARFREAFSDRLSPCSAGTRITFGVCRRSA